MSNFKCKPINQNGEHPPRPHNSPYEDFFFLRSEIEAVAKSHFSDFASYTDEEVLAYALKFVSDSTERGALTQDIIVKELQRNFQSKGLKITKDSTLFEDKIWPAVKGEKSVCKGGRPAKGAKA